MKPFRMSIAGILGFTAVCAAGIAVARDFSQFPAPRIASPGFWKGVLVTLTAQGLVYAAVRAWSRQASRRAFWRGLLAFAGGYLALCFYPWHNPWAQYPNMWFGTGYLPVSFTDTPLELPTSRLLDVLWRNYQIAQGTLINRYSDYGRFVQLGHLILGWIFGGIGGLIVSIAHGICARRSAVARASEPGSNEVSSNS